MLIPNLLQEGIASYKAGKIDRASEILARFIRTNPSSAEGWYWLGVCRIDPQQKRFCFQKALALDPNIVEALQELEKIDNASPISKLTQLTQDKPKSTETGFTGELDALRASLDGPDEKKLEQVAEEGSLEFEPVSFNDRLPGGDLEDLRTSLLSVEDPFKEKKTTPKKPLTTQSPSERTAQVIEEMDELRSSLVGSVYSEFDQVQSLTADEDQPLRDEPQASVDRLSSISEPIAPELVEQSHEQEAMPPYESFTPRAKSRRFRIRSVWWLPWVFLILLVLVVGGIILINTLGGLLPGLQTSFISMKATPTSTITPTRTPFKVTLLPSSTPVPTITSSPAPLYVSRFQGTSCNFTIPTGTVVECGYVNVPEDRSANLQRMIMLNVAIYHNLSGTNSNDPIIFIAGGPGSEAVSSMARNFKTFIEPIIKEKDFIVFDPRGTGNSQPSVDCPELKSVFIKDLTQQLDDNERLDAYSNSLEMCKNDLFNRGINPAAYSTVENATDVRDILQSLKYQQANLYGVSYGTRIAQEVMRSYPEIVRTAIFDSVLPLEVKLYNQYSATSDEALKALFSGCARDPVCSETYSNLENHYQSIVSTLDTQPVTITVPLSSAGINRTFLIDGTSLASAILWAMQRSDLLPTIPQSIERARLGDYSFIRDSLNLPVETLNKLSMGVYMTIMCHDQVYATTPQELAEDIQSNPSTEKLALNYALGNPETLFKICDLWETGELSPYENQPLISDIPTLILSGSYDPTTPPSFARMVSNHLMSSMLVDFPNKSHTPGLSTITSECGMSIILTYLRDPNAPLSIACTLDTASPAFLVPYTGIPPLTLVTSEALAPGISGDYPAGWNNSVQGFFYRRNSILDKTQLSVQNTQITTQDWIQILMKEFNGKDGFDAEPYRATSRAVNGLNWALYRTTSLGVPVDLAFAEEDDQTWMVLMLSYADERTAFYKTMFIPVIDSIVVND